MRTQTLSRKLIGAAMLAVILVWGALGPATAKKRLSQPEQVAQQAALRGQTPRDMVDSLLHVVGFQFIPGTLNGQVNGLYAIYKYRPSPDFPLWVMMNMGGPLYVDRQHFTLNRSEQRIIDGVDIRSLHFSCSDSLNGCFDLQFLVEAETGKAMLEVKQTARGALPPQKFETNRNDTTFLFQGYIFPEYLRYAYKNERAAQNAAESEQMLDRLVPSLNFRAGSRTINPTLLERQFARLVYLEKHNDTWYVRFEFPESRNRHQKVTVLDYSINARTAETYSRSGLYDFLFKNWTHYRGACTFTSSN